ncbi:hypothetical protein SBRY_70176 [Actinacidiphila bryophytorum]|uniref:Uncharacterized protein n=1 Tax=Actinacidiphila bryophytorum TaxID=1436133 RepID=A0A9W4H794_9ACTN|nr:hypothetical protein SBRY_70176 [Actinacidiphila bryophytorum]
MARRAARALAVLLGRRSAAQSGVVGDAAGRVGVGVVRDRADGAGLPRLPHQGRGVLTDTDDAVS